jgi:hypothetical protein
MKLKPLLLLILLTLTPRLLAEEAKVEISPGLQIDLANDDATFQELPKIKPGLHLCLWSGEALKAMATVEQFRGRFDERAFFGGVKEGLKPVPDKDIEIGRGTPVEIRSGLKGLRYESRYREDGEWTHVIYYLVSSADRSHMVAFVIFDEKDHAVLRERADKLIGTAVAIKPAKKSAPKG